MRWTFLLICLKAFCFDMTHYHLTTGPIDVVIPCIAKDLDTLELCIQGIKKYGRGTRRVIVISQQPLTSSAEWYSEENFPFSKEQLIEELGEENARPRAGWILQQLLKLYAPFVIPDLSPNVLVLDADTVFLNPVEFMNEQGEPLLDSANEYHESYFQHAARLVPGLHRVFRSHSGIVNHMLFQKPILEDLFALITEVHQTEPWKAICRCIDPGEIPRACVSEYEIYFNFAFLRTAQAKLRPLQSMGLLHLREIPYYQTRGYTYAFSHEWARKAFGGSSNWKGPLQ